MIYFDNAATTVVSDEALKAVVYMLKESFANPSSLHFAGFEAEKEIEKAKEALAKYLKCGKDEILFTSGGTEANNTAILGVAESYKRYGKHFITMELEHPSVMETYKLIEANGCKVTYVGADEKGYISFDELENAVCEETVLVSVMFVNNETGTLQDIEKIGKIIKKKNPRTLLHVDCVQAFGKHKISFKDADLISISGHKIHAPKGIGALYVKKGVRLKPLITGGGQQNGIRPGTENTSGIKAFSVAAEKAYENIEENFKRVLEVKRELLKVKGLLDGVYVNGDEENGSPYILNLSFDGVRAEVLLHALEDRGICVSTGSACSSRQRAYKGVIYRLNPERAEGAVRFSFSHFNTVDEAKECVKALCEIVPMLRKFKQR